jgi:hypothetical protein
MKTLPLILFATLLSTAGASQAAERGNCPERGRCRVAPVAPVPPVPPLAPLAPMAPIPPTDAITPEAPMPPMPPIAAMAPPPPPAPPALKVPNAAHDACNGKAIGARMTYSPRKGDTMRGTCQKDSQGMYFDVQEYRSVH